MRNKLQMLVKEVRQFLEKEALVGLRADFSYYPFKTGEGEMKKNLTQPRPLTAIPLPKKEQEKKQVILAGPKKVQKEKGEWQLQAFVGNPSDTSFHLWQKRLSTHTKTCEPEIKALLVLGQEEENSHRLFLETVSRAMTRLYVSTSVGLFHPKLFEHKTLKYLFAPLSYLEKYYPEVHIHQPFLIPSTAIHLIALDNLDLYEEDIARKRALWLAIQHLFQSSSI